MGNVQANETKQILSSYTNVVNSVVANVYNKALANCSSSNNLMLTTGRDCVFNFSDGTMNFKQVAGSNCKLDSINTTELTSSFNTEIINKTRNFIEQNAKNDQGWFATAFSLQINDAENVTDVMNQITNSFNVNFTNQCQSISNALNNANVDLCGYFDKTTFNFEQNAFVTAITSCVNKNVMNMWTSNSVLNDLWSKTDQKLASTQAGFSFVWLFLIIIALVILLIIGGIFYSKFKKSSG